MQLAQRTSSPYSPPRPPKTLLEIKHKLVEEIMYDVNFYEWTPALAAKELGLALPDFYTLRSGKDLKRFSVDRLLGCLIQLGHDIQVSVC